MAFDALATLASVCSLIADCPHSTPVWTDSGHLVIRNQNIKGGRLDLSSKSFTDSEHFQHRTRRAKPQFGDLIITREAPMGEVCMVPNGIECCLGQRQVLLRPNPSQISSRFLLYVIQSHAIQQQIAWNEGTGSTVSNIRIPVLEGIKIPHPPLVTQEEVAETLGALDDKIALLRETNATLEAIAQAIFKSWFVDFDPVRAKAEGRDPEGVPPEVANLFPSELEDSELGAIPKGWRVVRMGAIATPTIGGIWGTDSSESDSDAEVICLRGVDLEHLRASGWAPNAPIRWVKKSALLKRQLSFDEVLVAGSGAGPVGRTLWVSADLEMLYGKPVVFSNFVKRFKCPSKALACFVDRTLAGMRESGEMSNYVNGTSVPNLNDKSLLASKRVILPAENVLNEYMSIIAPMLGHLYSPEPRILIDLRDTLLPRLMSGKLRIQEVEA